MKHCLLSAQGANRAGLVAEITGLLHQTGVNITDSSMTTLRGEFVMMLLLELPPHTSLEELQHQGKQIQGLRLHWQALSPEEAAGPATPEQPSHAISVIGPDQTGLVHQVSLVLARRQLNICNVETQLLSQGKKPTYAMVMEIQMAQEKVSDLQDELSALAQDLGVDMHLHALEYAEI